MIQSFDAFTLPSLFNRQFMLYYFRDFLSIDNTADKLGSLFQTKHYLDFHLPRAL